MVELVRRYGRYGYRKIAALLRSTAGWVVNDKRVERIWRLEGLKVPARQPKRGRLWLADGSCIRLRAEGPNHVWSYDFVEDRTHDGRKYRMLNIIDEFTHECLAIRIDRRLKARTLTTNWVREHEDFPPDIWPAASIWRPVCFDWRAFRRNLCGKVNARVTVIRAPIEGVVSLAVRSIGARVNAGELVAEVVDDRFDTARLTPPAHFPGPDFPDVSNGQRPIAVVSASHQSYETVSSVR